jgi:hypothetical protein
MKQIEVVFLSVSLWMFSSCQAFTPLCLLAQKPVKKSYYLFPQHQQNQHDGGKNSNQETPFGRRNFLAHLLAGTAFGNFLLNTSSPAQAIDAMSSCKSERKAL